MGTSGSYGGSQKQKWKDARQQILNLPDGGSSGDASQGGDVESQLENLWGTIADALDSDDPTLHAPVEPGSPRLQLQSLLPWLASSNGGATSGGGRGGSATPRTGGGREGARSRRQVVRSAARGGTALAAAFAVRSGDEGYLAEIGLDLARLRTLSPVRQCAEILDAVLGEGAHPDELALRRAALEALKQVLSTAEPPNEVQTLRTFVASYVFELALVEIQRQLNEGGATHDDVVRKESMIKGYIERRTAAVTVDQDGVVSPTGLTLAAVRLTNEVIKLLRARGAATTP